MAKLPWYIKNQKITYDGGNHINLQFTISKLWIYMQVPKIFLIILIRKIWQHSML